MTASAIFLSVIQFAGWELALFIASMRLARGLSWRGCQAAEETWLAVLAIQVTFESSLAALLSFAGMNSVAAYSIAAACALAAAATTAGRHKLASTAKSMCALAIFRQPRAAALTAVLIAPLVLLSFKPVEDIDSINYLHFLIDWMANRATPYTFASNYVAFWELSFMPSWMITGVDLFFPLLALKGVALLALALWLVGGELKLRPSLLLWTVFGSILFRQIWFEHSGVATLKNDVLHGAGFVLLTLVVLRATARRLSPTDLVLLAFGIAFATVKYSGIFLVIPAIGAVTLLERRVLRENPRVGVVAGISVAAFFLLTSGHYYLRSLIQFGNPLFPFAINIGFIHLPGTADLSATSILYSLHDTRLWQAFFLPSGGISPMGLLFPATLTAALLIGVWCCVRAVWKVAVRGVNATTCVLRPVDWASIAILLGWILYFRSYYSASASPGDLKYILSSLSSLRYLEGVLAVSEIVIVVLLARITWIVVPLVALNAASRLLILYMKLPFDLFPPILAVAPAGLVFVLFLGPAFLELKRRPAASILAAGLCLVIGGPFVVERNRARWTTYWNDFKPVLHAVPGSELVELALPDGGWFAGHIVAAGNPVRTTVRSLLISELAALAPPSRPRYLAVMLDPGSEAAGDWHSRYGDQFAGWGYEARVDGKLVALLERTVPPDVERAAGPRKLERRRWTRSD